MQKQTPIPREIYRLFVQTEDEVLACFQVRRRIDHTSSTSQRQHSTVTTRQFSLQAQKCVPGSSSHAGQRGPPKVVRCVVIHALHQVSPHPSCSQHIQHRCHTLPAACVGGEVPGAHVSEAEPTQGAEGHAPGLQARPRELPGGRDGSWGLLVHCACSNGWCPQVGTLNRKLHCSWSDDGWLPATTTSE